MGTESGWLSGRGLAAFAGGAVVALIASRVLPPLLAQAAGSARVAAGRDPFDTLIQDHRVILSLLGEMEVSPEHATVRRTQLLLRLKRKLAAHAMAEEDVVYPMLHDRAQEVEDTRRLYAEHADMKMMLFQLETMPKDGPDWRATVARLRTLIADHIHQEEDIDFPRLRDRLEGRETALLSGGISREKALIL